MLRLCSLMETLLKRSTYMQPPLLYRDPPNKVICLCCVLYNSNMQLELGFLNSIAPSHNLVSLLAHMTPFLIQHTGVNIILLLLYVDDMIITENDT
jgi:hypothetical protein